MGVVAGWCEVVASAVGVGMGVGAGWCEVVAPADGGQVEAVR